MVHLRSKKTSFQSLIAVFWSINQVFMKIVLQIFIIFGAFFLKSFDKTLFSFGCTSLRRRGLPRAFHAGFHCYYAAAAFTCTLPRSLTPTAASREPVNCCGL